VRPALPQKLSSYQPFVVIGGGGAVVQPAMLRRDSTATSASASFFIGGPALIDAATYKRERAIL
jgi:hypothetical protein